MKTTTTPVKAATKTSKKPPKISETKKAVKKVAPDKGKVAVASLTPVEEAVKNRTPVLDGFEKANPHTAGWNNEAAEQVVFEFRNVLDAIWEVASLKEFAELWQRYNRFGGHRKLGRALLFKKADAPYVPKK